MKAVSPSFAFTALLALVPMTVTAETVRPEDVGMSSERLDRITRSLDAHIAAGDLTGAVAIVARHGKVVHHVAQGTMDLESHEPVTTRTMFRIASMTKPIVGAAIMMLVEEGKVHLSDPVERYIPSFANMQVAVSTPSNDTGASGNAMPFHRVPAERPITIKDLLTHVSGLGSGPMGNSDIDKVARKDGEKLADYIPRLGSTALEFQPGSRWTYSPGAGFETLGYIIELASGMPLDAFLRTRIFEPLGMTDITFWPAERDWQRVIPIYRKNAGGKLEKTPYPNDTMSRGIYFRGSGGLYSTAEAYIPFGIMLASGGEANGRRLLGSKTVELLRAVHVPDTLPGRPAGEGFGLSVRVVTDHAARDTLLSNGTYGWSGAHGTHFFVDPEEELVGVLMIQTPDRELRREFEDLVAQAIID